MATKPLVKASEKAVAPRKSSTGELTLVLHIKALKLPPAVREFEFHPQRKWRFDFAYPDLMVAFEVEGGHWTNGRHTRGKGFEQDCEKYNQAALLGWRVFRFTTEMVKSGQAVKIINQIFEELEWNFSKM